MLYDYFHQIDFADDVGLTINTSFSKIDRNNLSDFNSVFGSQNWDKIDFRKFSKKLTPSLERYQFNWEEIFRNVNQQNP